MNAILQVEKEKGVEVAFKPALEECFPTLEIAQSKLMDNIHCGWNMQNKECDCSNESKDSLLLKVAFQADTSKRIASDTVKIATSKSEHTFSLNFANFLCPVTRYRRISRNIATGGKSYLP